MVITPCVSALPPFLAAQCCGQERRYARNQGASPSALPRLRVETRPGTAQLASSEACGWKRPVSAAPCVKGGGASSPPRFSWASTSNLGSFAALQRQPSSCNCLYLLNEARHRKTSEGEGSPPASVVGTSCFDLCCRRLRDNAYFSPLASISPSSACSLPSPPSLNSLFGTTQSSLSSCTLKAQPQRCISRHPSWSKEATELAGRLSLRMERHFRSRRLAACSSPPDSQAKPRPPGRFYEPVLGVDFPETFLPQKTFGRQAPVPHDCVGVAPRCMHDLCWIPAARAYAIAVYVHRNSLRDWKLWYNQRRHSDEKGLETKQEEEELSLLFAPEIEKTLVFTFVGNKNPDHILKGFERALANAVPRNMDTGSKGTLNKEIQAFIQALRSCSFKPLCSLAVTLLPTEELASATPGPKAMDSPAAEVSNQGVSEPLESVNDSPATVVLMYKESDGQSFQLLASVPSRFLSLALHNLYLDGWGSPEPRYQSISRRFREGARKLLEAKVA